MQVGNLFHAEPAEFYAANGTRHVIARSVVHFYYGCGASWARFDVVCKEEKKKELIPLDCQDPWISAEKTAYRYFLQIK